MNYKEFLGVVSTPAGYSQAKVFLSNLWKQGQPSGKRTLWAVYKWATSNNLI